MNRLYDAIYALCVSHGISGGKLCAEIGIQRSLLTDLKMGRKQSLSTETLKKIADYFEVSVDYLLTGEETEKAAPSSEDGELEEMLEYIRRSPELRTMFSLFKKATPDELRQYIKVIKAIRGED